MQLPGPEHRRAASPVVPCSPDDSADEVTTENPRPWIHMTPVMHYVTAERLLAQHEYDPRPGTVETAKVHAMLARCEFSPDELLEAVAEMERAREELKAKRQAFRDANPNMVFRPGHPMNDVR